MSPSANTRTSPSMSTRDTAVRYVHIEGGVYERGGAKVNRKEAEAVVAEVVRRLKTSTQSIGVVTFNGDQQRLIENMLDQARRSDPALEAHFDRNRTNVTALLTFEGAPVGARGSGLNFGK
jgi:hypothetical protein